jgi:ribonuclease-3
VSTAAPPDPVAALAERLPHRFSRPELLLHALTHRSAADPRRQMLDSNERLEFVGDRVLALAMAEWLAERFPEEREGDLGKRLAVLVAQDSLAKVAASLGVAAALRIPANEERSGVRKPRQRPVRRAGGAAGRGLPRWRARTGAGAGAARMGASAGGLGPAPGLAQDSAAGMDPRARARPARVHAGLVGRAVACAGLRGAGAGAGRDAEGTGENKRAAEQAAAERLLAELGA